MLGGKATKGHMEIFPFNGTHKDRSPGTGLEGKVFSGSLLVCVSRKNQIKLHFSPHAGFGWAFGAGAVGCMQQDLLPGG